MFRPEGRMLSDVVLFGLCASLTNQKLWIEAQLHAFLDVTSDLCVFDTQDKGQAALHKPHFPKQKQLCQCAAAAVIQIELLSSHSQNWIHRLSYLLQDYISAIFFFRMGAGSEAESGPL